MQRRRDLAASPVRTAAETWTTLCDLVADTLDRSASIDRESVVTELDRATPAGVALVAGGHTDRLDVTLVAADLRLTVRTVSGADAFRALDDENLNAVPGAATAENWALHLPRPEALAGLIDDVIADTSHLGTGQPSTNDESEDQATAALIDLTRLDPTRRT